MSTSIEEIEKTEKGEDKKSELLLASLEIKGYRCFEDLTIEKLGRVNLIVGKNNVGKTALLEALWIYAEGSSWDKALETMNSVLGNRNEKIVKNYGGVMPQSQLIRILSTGDEFRHLFYLRPKQGISNFFINTNISERDTTYGIHVAFNAEVPQISSTNHSERNFHKKISNLYVNSKGLDIEFLIQYWDEIILNNNEENIVNSLKIITPQVIDLNFIGYPKGAEKRVPIVRISNVGERVPLKSLGEGMSRLLGIAMALVNCKTGILLIDEIESGLHYSVLPDIWKLIFKTARDLNVQVFATTHSNDCVEAFAIAANESPEDGMLIRLERQNERILAKTIDEENLGLAVDYGAEVR